MTTIRPTRIHQLLGADLGEVPNWVCSNANGGISIADLLPGSVFAVGSGACSALALMIGCWALPLAVAIIIGSAILQHETAQLKRVERKCRARLRRNECLNCGTKLEESVRLERSCDQCRSTMPKMVTKLPMERDFDPYGGGLDEQCAWRNFGGLTLDEAYLKFESAPEVYQEDFMWMGGKAFAFYFPVIDRFLRRTIELREDERGDRQSSILPFCIFGQFNGADRRYVAPLKKSVVNLCDFMLQHMESFVDDWSDPKEMKEIETHWRWLRDHVSQYPSH